jgi:hypothetical protein
MLDMEGVFASTSQWVEKASTSGSEQLMSETDAQKLLQEEPIGILSQVPAILDMKQMTSETDLKPEEIEQIISGKPPSSISTKTLSDSVLFDLSDEDRDILETINKQKM